METVLYLMIVLGCFFFAYRTMIAKDILSAAIYLACASALTSALLYMLGATQVAVIELSVGAGLVTVLMVYAISVVGKDVADPPSIVPKLVAAAICLLAMGVIVVVSLPLLPGPSERTAQPLVNTLWQGRVLDVWIQMVLLFSGVMGILGLLTDHATQKPAHSRKPNPPAKNAQAELAAENPTQSSGSELP